MVERYIRLVERSSKGAGNLQEDYEPPLRVPLPNLNPLSLQEETNP